MLEVIMSCFAVLFWYNIFNLIMVTKSTLVNVFGDFISLVPYL